MFFSESLPFRKLFLALIPTTLLQAFSIYCLIWRCSKAIPPPPHWIMWAVSSSNDIFWSVSSLEPTRLFFIFPPTSASYTNLRRTTYVVCCPFWNRNMILAIFSFSTIWPNNWKYLKISTNTSLFSCSSENGIFCLYLVFSKSLARFKTVAPWKQLEN